MLTLPNVVTSLRFPLAAGFVLADGTPMRVTLIGLASATDLLDGWLARRTGSTTRSGALLDPIADKTFVLAALTAFVIHRELSLRDFATILSRDIGTAIGALVAWLMPGLTVRDFRARMPGKVVTVLQLVALLVLSVAPQWLHPIVLAIGLASVVALADYTLALALALPRRP